MVSIIIPCFNQGEYINETIQSIESQSYSNYEIIIVNDGSNDEKTISILNELKLKKYHLINIENSGVSAARNTGISYAKGNYILSLDADDKIGAEYLTNAVKVLDGDASKNLVYCDCEFFGSKEGISSVLEFSMLGMLNENLIFNAAVIRKDTFVKTSGYDPTFIDGWEDWEFWLRFITDEKEVHKLPGVHFYYRIKEISRNSTIVGERLQACEQQLYKKHIDLFFKINSNPISLLREQNFYKAEYKKLEHYRSELLQSMSYKLGNFLLSPLKWFRK